MGKGRNEVTCLRSHHESGGKWRQSWALPQPGMTRTEAMRPFNDPPTTHIATANKHCTGALCQALGPPMEPMEQVLSLQAQVPDKKYKNEVTKRPQGPEHRHGKVGVL